MILPQPLKIKIRKYSIWRAPKKVDFDNLKFRKKDVLGAGFFGEVFKVTTDGKKYDDRFVAKVFHTPKA